MPDKNGNKYSNVKYNRELTRVEKELQSRGWGRKDYWVLVCNNTTGKRFNHDELDTIMDNAQYSLGTQKIENIAMACNVSFMTVVDWIRFDAEPEKITAKMFEIYRKRLAEEDNQTSIRWFLAMLCRKKIPIFEILEAAANGYDFKKESNYLDKNKWVYKNLISKGIVIDPSKKKTSDKDKEKDSKQ